MDTLATALYATTDDMLKEHPDLAPWRPPVGITPRQSDAELVILATVQAIPGYNKQLRRPQRFFWGLCLPLVRTLQGLPIAFALTGAKADERDTLLELLAAECELLRERPRQTLIGDTNQRPG